MHISILFENQKTFTIFDINSGAETDLTEELKYNGTILVRNVDYTVYYPINSIAVISSLIRDLKSTDDLDIKLYNTDKTVLLDQLDNIPINFNFNYLEVSGDVTNGVLPSDTTDKSNLLNTPLEIRSCQGIFVNAHLLHIINIGAYTNSNSGAILINGEPAESADFDKSTHPSLLPLTFDVDGVLTSTTDEPTIIEFASIPKTAPVSIEVEMTRNDGFGIDAFLLDGVGFRRIESNEPLWVDITGTNNVISPTPTIGTIFKVEVTTTHLNIICDGVTLASYPRKVNYSSDKGVFVPSGEQDYLTEVVYHPLDSGTGEIKATFGQVSARQVINNKLVNSPYFGSSSTFTNTCPSTSFNLGSLVDITLKSGIELHFFSDNTTDEESRITNLSISELGTRGIYARQYDPVTDCYSSYNLIYVTIISCIMPEIEDFDVSICSGTIVDPIITNNVSSPSYMWRKNSLVIGYTKAISITESGVYELTVSGDGKIVAKEGTITIIPNISIVSNLPSMSTVGTPLSVTISNPSSIVDVIWERLVSGVWTSVLESSTYTNYTPSLIGEYRVRVIGQCNDVTSITSIVYADAVNDNYSVTINNNLTGNVSTNDQSCYDPDGDIRTFYKVVPSSLTSGELLSFSETTGIFEFKPDVDFTGLVTFDYKIYCTTHESNDPELALFEDQATVTINVLCQILEDFQLEYDPIAIYSSKCYEKYKIVNITPSTTEIENISIVGEGFEITRSLDDNLEFIGKATRKKSLKIIITMTFCDGATLVREFIQAVSLKKCCN